MAWKSTGIPIGRALDPGLPLRERLEHIPFDYLIGSVHEVDGFTIDGSPAGWQSMSQDQIDHIHRRYWQNMKSLGESGLFDIVAHMDLPKKFGFLAACDLTSEIGEALDAIAAAPNQPVVELNTAGWHKACADGYPTLEILRECRRHDIPVTISADAHQPEHLLRDFDKAAARLAEAGYTEVVRFAAREKRFESLAAAVPKPAADAMRRGASRCFGFGNWRQRDHGLARLDFASRIFGQQREAFGIL